MASKLKIMVVAACATLFLSMPTQTIASAESDYQSGVSAYKAHDFKTAAQYLRRASQQNSSPALLLYLGHACFGSADKTGALAAYQQILNTYPNSPEAKLARTCIARIEPSAGQQLSQGETRRWTPQSMPLKVYISNGLELSAGIAGRVLRKDEFRALSKNFKNPAFMRGLRTSAKYVAQDSVYVRDGLDSWNSVGDVVQFRTTENAAEADILIFFVNVLSDKRSGCCLYPYEAGEPNIIEIALSEFKEGEFKEAWTKIEPAVAAHEIGHAFGLDHSADKGDMMYDHEILNLDGEGGLTLTRQVTDNDKAALRALYSKPAKYSVKSGK